ncbi:hypothetical protein WMO13_04295 [Ignatzschineria larvae DSM 13226]|uniref:Uncharacterized protein n=1 Tax=Ignatzschineria larvae DSM 13226 TaxID=1111732 RepID=A0ABZ3C1V0_9GAMM|nr:hypothetical protein [Ignatzschineria larvae]
MELVVIGCILLVALSSVRFVFGFASRIVSFFVRTFIRLVFILIFIVGAIWVYDYYKVYQNRVRIDAESTQSMDSSNSAGNRDPQASTVIDQAIQIIKK